MLQEANPKFYKEQLMMAKQGIELGDHGPGAVAELLRVPCLGRSRGVG